MVPSLEKIASFKVNHDKLNPGLYTSRVDGGIVTYDLRATLPNRDAYMDNDEMHTFEHLFATYARNSGSGFQVVYFGPMGCRTGFYLLVRDSLTPKMSIELIRQTLSKIAAHEGEIPGCSEIECGNAGEHSLPKAKARAANMAEILRDWTPERLAYEE